MSKIVEPSERTEIGRGVKIIKEIIKENSRELKATGFKDESS